MNKFLNVVLTLLLSIFISACDTSSTDGGGDYTAGGGDIMSSAGNMMGGNMAGSDMAGGDPMALAAGGDGAMGDNGDPIAMIMGDDGGSSGSTSTNARFTNIDRYIQATINGTYYKYIAATDRDKQIKMSGYMMGSDGQYVVQIVGYDIKEDRLNPTGGFLMIQFKMPMLDSGTGTYDLLYPMSKDGQVEIKSINSFNNGYDIRGVMPVATTYGDRNSTIEIKNVAFDVHLVNMKPAQQQ